LRSLNLLQKKLCFSSDANLFSSVANWLWLPVRGGGVTNHSVGPMLNATDCVFTRLVSIIKSCIYLLFYIKLSLRLDLFFYFVLPTDCCYLDDERLLKFCS